MTKKKWLFVFYQDRDGVYHYPLNRKYKSDFSTWFFLSPEEKKYRLNFFNIIFFLECGLDSSANNSLFKQFYIEKAGKDVEYREYMHFITHFLQSKRYTFHLRKSSNSCGCSIFWMKPLLLLFFPILPEWFFEESLSLVLNQKCLARLVPVLIENNILLIYQIIKYILSLSIKCLLNYFESIIMHSKHQIYSFVLLCCLFSFIFKQ